MLSRRNFLKTAFALPAGSWILNYETLAAPIQRKVKITDIKAMMLKNPGKNTLLKVETDAGLVGYGEAGTTGAIARARIETLKPLLIGRDPLAIEHHFHNMTTDSYPYVPHIPTISAIDMALWDIAGKTTGLPVSTLLGGPFRERVRLYINSQPRNMLDKASCREWAAQMKEDPRGWTTFKVVVTSATSIPPYKLSPMASTSDLAKIEQAFANVREALGSEMDIIAHCHNEFDLPSAIGVARAIEPMRPLALEDPIAVPYSESWVALRRSVRVPIMTGEKLELSRQFFPFMHNQAVDIIHPDIAYSGGFTGTRKIVDLASLYRIPVALHNVGLLVLTMATVHFAASFHDFAMSENLLTFPLVTEMAAGAKPVVKGSYMEVPDSPGIGVELDPEVLRANLEPGEPWWG